MTVTMDPMTTFEITNTTVANNFGLYSILVTSLNVPFIFVFFILFLVSLVSFLIQKKQLKKNQRILFMLLFTVSISALIQNITRVACEMSYFHQDLKTADRINSGIKVIDRTMISIVLFSQICVMAFICYVFMQTTISTKFVTEMVFRRSKYILISIVIIIGVVLSVLDIIIVSLHSAIAANANLSTNDVFIFQQVVLLSISVVGFFSIVAISIMLNYYAFKLYNSLKESKNKIKEMIKHNMKSVESMSELGNTQSVISDETSTATSTTVRTTSPTVTTTGTTPMDVEMSKEQEQTYKVKKTALQKTLAIQIGLTISLFVQFSGFIFIPFGLYYVKYLWCIFHMFSNCGVVLFISLLLGIYHPLTVVQKLFKVPSNEKLKELKDTPLVKKALKVEMGESV
ncbi:hypothetical protein ABK040_003386 [Willaertia magna]